MSLGNELEDHRYTAALAGRIEAQWQDHWQEQGTFEAPNPAGPMAAPEAVAGRDKLYVLDMFPYPSGSGLHVGHPLGYIATDVYARYQRMNGYNVLHTMGYDAFGLPAEQYAVQTGQHPRVTTEDNIANMRRQLRRLGLGHDMRRSVATTDTDFYRWTQWIFLQVFNSWYDPSAPRRDGGTGSARPISDLIAEFASGARPTPDGRAWSGLTAVEQAAIVDGYRLAFVSKAPVNWCPGLGTVLANEEVTADGRSDRGNFPVFKANLSQWMMRITAYADRLLEDLDRLEWSDALKSMQRNWIGRSEGARVRFASVAGEIEVFTTRPDTLFGATFMVLAPEHPLVDGLVAANAEWPEGTRAAWTGGATDPAAAVAAYRAQAAAKTDLERQVDAKDKTGVFTGAFAVNPVNGASVPVFIADYVLMGYGTGAIMAVPAQDERDWAFAEKFDVPIVRTVQPPADWEADGPRPWTGDGVAINSENVSLYGDAGVDLNGLGVAAAKRAIIDWLDQRGMGTAAVTYKLRDWLFSRQRYWGEPFPVVYDEGGYPIALPESMLPVELPEVQDYSPRTFDPDDANTEPEAPLARATEWVHVELDLGDGPKMYRRETNTMPQWAGSCWYEMRYLDPTNQDAFVDPAVEEYWMGPRAGRSAAGVADPGGVDLYVGGVEHAVLHLLYARFWHKVLYDLGHVSSAEPFRRLFNQGYIQAYAYKDAREMYVPAAEVEADAASPTGFSYQGEPVTQEYGKMGKSLRNSVTPDEMCADYGADTLRLYEMSMGPLDVSRPWETKAVVGSYRFLQRLWRNIVDEATGLAVVTDEPLEGELLRALHRTIAGVRNDVDGLRFNTAIAKMIEFNNALGKHGSTPRAAAEALVLMVAPFAPHIAEELWRRLGHQSTLAYADFPVADPALLVEATVECILQVGGKLRGKATVPVDISEDDLVALALAAPGVQRALAGRGVRKVIARAPRLVNIVPA